MLKWIRDPWNAAERRGIDQGAVFPAGLHIGSNQANAAQTARPGMAIAAFRGSPASRKRPPGVCATNPWH
jgi:hypothetical protein